MKRKQNDYTPLYKVAPDKWERRPPLYYEEETASNKLLSTLAAGLMAATVALLCIPFYFIRGCNNWFNKFLEI